MLEVLVKRCFRLPIIGNILQVMNKPWLLSKDCKDRFGEIVYLDVAGQRGGQAVLNTHAFVKAIILYKRRRLPFWFHPSLRPPDDHVRAR
ncbi:hypothetical protein BC827DRAFT_413964 [Russula dissimulans]|nr:hypothetical protein BC827DRAFT_413964 [Russula dissimulans]